MAKVANIPIVETVAILAMLQNAFTWSKAMILDFPRSASSGELVAERIEGVCETPRGGLGALDYLKLDVPYERDRYCKECDAKARFLWIFELWNGHLGVCLSCGVWAVAPYTRSVEE